MMRFIRIFCWLKTGKALIRVLSVGITARKAETAGRSLADGLACRNTPDDMAGYGRKQDNSIVGQTYSIVSRLFFFSSPNV